jgi:hypothetical protein
MQREEPMRRTAVLILFVALVAGLVACAADAPNPTSPKGNSGGSKALQVSLFTTNANPTAGLCTTVQAVVTLNGSPVSDGTGVNFSTDFGIFAENSQPTVSIVTQGGTATGAVCSTLAGVAKVRASVTVAGSTASSSISISFQSSAASIPFFSFCSPNNGPNTGGTLLTITGGLFFGDASSTRVQFTSMGVTRQGVVQTVTATTVGVLTPAFPEAVSPSVPVDITITFGTNTGSPVTVSAPSCFVYGSFAGDQPKITAVLPSTGSNDGGTRVTIIGSGFVAPMQVFFGTIEAPPPTSVTYNQIVVLSPPASGPGLINRNANVGIRVHNTVSGKEDTYTGGFTYVTALQITAIGGANVQRIDSPFTPLTIFGNGFSSPMAVSLAGVAAFVSSVSATELVVVPGFPLTTSCADVTGDILVVNVNNGDSAKASGQAFTYLIQATGPVISGVSPQSGEYPIVNSVTISGFNFPTSPSGVEVLIGTRTAKVLSAFPTALVVQLPDPQSTVAPACGTGQAAGTEVPIETDDVTVTNRLTTCSTKAAKAFAYTRPCI